MTAGDLIEILKREDSNLKFEDGFSDTSLRLEVEDFILNISLEFIK